MGKFKWKALSIPYARKRRPPAPDLVERAVGVFRDAGLTAH
jgi:hypothetical protein